MNAFGLAPLLLVFPAIGALLNGLFGRRFVDNDRKTGEKWSGWFASIMALSSFAIAVMLLLSLIGNGYHAETITIFDWFYIPSANFRIPWALQIDTLSVTMLMVVTGVGSLIHIYAIGYMHGDPDFSRFFTYLNWFLFFMLILVTGNSYLMLFVGWEGVGLCSFLLIGFWFGKDNKDADGIYEGVKNANAARKAFVANRVGDFAMIMAMILLFWTFGSLEFDTIFHESARLFEVHNEHVIRFGSFSATIGSVLTAVTALFLMGAAGKSAQIPLYVWLPDAMAGPTPVSALIHAATMVTSGIYLITRSNVLFEIVRESGALLFGVISSPDLVAYVGASTALVAGLIAFTQFDIKKVLAYSTVSQLGFMIAAVGMGAYVAGMFHLITHAFFKALLFMGSGSVIHGMEHGHHHVHDHHHSDSKHGTPQGDHHDEPDGFDPQDMRTMGGLRKQMPTTFIVYMIGSLALAGIFPLAGFWSKDEILAHGQEHNLIVYVLLSIAAVCTAFYMGRQIKMVFFGEARHEAASHAEESPPLMTNPLIVLAGLSIVGGFVLNLPYLSEAAADANGRHPHGLYLILEGWLEHSIEAFHLSAEGVVHLPHTPIVLSPSVALISTAMAIIALVLAFNVVYGSKPSNADEPDPFRQIPVIGPLVWWFGILPFNTFYSKVIIPAFNWEARFLADKVDWAFWHDFFHERVVRDTFVGFANFASDILDAKGVDGALVNGTAKMTARLADLLRLVQTGYARNYALGLFLGVVALLAYFILMAN